MSTYKPINTITSWNLSPEENTIVLEKIRENYVDYFRLPKIIERNPDVPYTCFVMLRIKSERVDDLLRCVNIVHEETDKFNLDVYSHRSLVPRDQTDDQSLFCVVVDYDNADGFYKHYQNPSLRNIYSCQDFLVEPPRLSFYVDSSISSSLE